MSIRFPVLLIACVTAVLAMGIWLWNRPQPVPAGETGKKEDADSLPGIGKAPASSVRMGKRTSGGEAVPRRESGQDAAFPGTLWEDATEYGGDEGLAETASGREVPEWNPPPVSEETLSFIRDAFGKWRSSPRDEAAAADLRLALAGKMSREEMLAAAASLMRLGTVQDRLDAMWIVENEFFTPYNEEQLVRVNIDDGEDPGGEEGGVDAATLAEEEREAAETHELVSLVGTGFEDSDPGVRQAAYAAAMELSRERNNILLSQLLCSDSPVSRDLRRQLMEELAGGTDEESMSLFIVAMQSPDVATAAAAKASLEAIAGRTFGDVLEAADWLEERENPPPEPDADADFDDIEPMENNQTGDMTE
jgi:hypothetical protein